MSELLSDQPRLMSLRDVAVAMGTKYTSYEAAGVTVVVISAGLSLLCSMVLLGFLAISMWKKRSAPTDHFFVRTHAAAYFASLILADAIQGVGSIMSAKWVKEGGVSATPFCSGQGAIKNAGNLAVSLWALVLAIHAFSVLFLRKQPKDWVLYVTLVGVWLLVGLLVVIGPGAIQQANLEPFFGVSGYWCWITDAYPVSRVTLEYAWMFTSAGLSFVFYTLTFLRLRGNIVLNGRKMKFVKVDSLEAWQSQVTRSSSEIQMTGVMMGMIWFPILFTALIVPIAVCRFISWSGKPVPFEATIFADSVFSLMGVFDLILFATTRSLFPRENIWLFSPRPTIPAEVMKHGFQPYHVQDFASAHGFNETYQSQAEKGMVTVPPRTSASLGHSETPSRPPRPLSLGEVPRPPMPPVPEDDYSMRRNPARMTVRTVASRYSQDGEMEPAWDNVALDQTSSEASVSPRQDRFTSSPNIRDTRFTVSAYQYHEGPGDVPPMPSGAGIDLSAGRNYDDEDDEQHLTQAGHSRRHSDDSLYER